MRSKTNLVAAVAVACLSQPVLAEPVKVVTTLSVYSAIAAEIGGDRVEAKAIARGDEDAHFVKPKPSYALMLRDADLFVTTGLDLELWSPALVDKSGNRGIRDGEPGFVAAAQGVTLRDVPATASREAGDVHIYGNPHIYTSPIETKIVARNIAAGLERVDPGGAALYRANLTSFKQRIDIALYGEVLVELLGSETLDALARDGKLIDFLEAQSYEERPLIDRLGGWLGEGRSFRGNEIIAYHKNWVYFTDLFGLEVIDFVEPKPGIPPSARHVKQLIDEIEKREIEVLIAADYFDKSKPELIAERTGSTALIMPLGTGGAGGETYFELVGTWIGRLSRGFRGGG